MFSKPRTRSRLTREAITQWCRSFYVWPIRLILLRASRVYSLDSKTRISDWDELLEAVVVQLQFFWQSPRPALTSAGDMSFRGGERSHRLRSEERRVGKECRSRWSP